MAALYLRGLARPAESPRGRWRAVEHALRAVPNLDPAEALSSAGLWLEASVLRDGALREKAAALCRSRRVLTVFCSGYPNRWLQWTFAPPALWLAGELPEGTPMTIVGSRHLTAPAQRFARDAGVAVAMAGGVVVSGGAIGADRAAAFGAAKFARECGAVSPVIEILPCGLGRSERRAAGATLSLAAPDETFSTALAMERNALLYACSDRALVVAARFKEGGTWVGATDALRRRLTTLFIRNDGTKGASALMALGATPVQSGSAFPLEVPRLEQSALLIS